MTEDDAIRRVLLETNTPRFTKEKLPWWRRLLASLHLDIKPGKRLSRPVNYVGIRGKIDF